MYAGTIEIMACNEVLEHNFHAVQMMMMLTTKTADFQTDSHQTLSHFFSYFMIKLKQNCTISHNDYYNIRKKLFYNV